MHLLRDLRFGLFNGARNHYGKHEDSRDDFVEPVDSQAATPAQGGRSTASTLTRVSPRVANGAPAPHIVSGLFARRG